MSFIDLKFLIFAQIGIDIAIILVFIVSIKKLRSLKLGPVLSDEVKIIESLLRDADKLTGQFKEQLQEKKHLIKKLNDQMDKKIMSLNLFLNRSDALLSQQREVDDENRAPVSVNSPEEKVLRLAKEGRDIENIADTLLMSKEEVRLVLDIKKKISRLNLKEGGS